MNVFEKKAAFSLSIIYGLRMLGLFMILPVFALYAEGLEGVTPTLIGLALGAYGLTLAIFQIPFGRLSDRFGRKPIIAIGFLLFACGSAVAAMSDSIWGVIFGRALQGSGAIAAVVMALIADLTRVEERTKAMAIFGIGIGFAFMLSLITAPLINAWVGVQGIFWLTAIAGLLAIPAVFLLVPNPEQIKHHSEVESNPAQMRSMLADGQLMRLNIGILLLQWMMMAMFTALPVVLRDQIGLPTDQHWWLYLGALLLSIIAMIPMVIIAEKKQKVRGIFLISISFLFIAGICFTFLHASLWGAALALLLFFIGFNTLEALLPSLLSRMAPAGSKGAAMGVYSTFQFLGAFFGGAFGGWLYGQTGAVGVFACGTILAIIWFFVAIGMRPPSYSTKMLDISNVPKHQVAQLQTRLLQIRGVCDAQVQYNEGVAFLKVEKQLLDEDELNLLVAKPAQ
ncbi:MAG: MFS transporter [Mariprofundales bacterium]